MIKDPKYGIPQLKKFPLPDARHVKSAIKFFNYVPPRYEKQLAAAIIRRMKEYGMSFEDFTVGDENRFIKYVPKTYLAHYGILGMHWGIRRYQPYPKGYRGDGKFTGKKANNVDVKINKIVGKGLSTRRTLSGKEVQRGLSPRKERKLHKLYVSKMKPEELKTLVKLLDDEERALKAESDAWTEYEKRFSSDPDRAKIVRNWDGDGSELYEKMQSIMPDDRMEKLSDSSFEAMKKREEYARSVVNRITEETDRRYEKIDGPTARPWFHRDSASGHASTALYRAADEYGKKHKKELQSDTKRSEQDDMNKQRVDNNVSDNVTKKTSAQKESDKRYYQKLDRALAMYKSGKSVKDISKIVGVNMDAIYDYIDDNTY